MKELSKNFIRCGDWAITQLLESFAYNVRSPEFNLQHHINLSW